MKVKLVFQKSTGAILGAQLVGKSGVNKRIDIVAAAIVGGLTVSDLGMMDISYAPPYSPVYDPLQVCANVAEKQVGNGA
jgi:pyruvate/2-oxoglutarate dehydrogenase complex dihydrolipoamide dehydrogenase (E3) component